MGPKQDRLGTLHMVIDMVMVMEGRVREHEDLNINTEELQSVMADYFCISGPSTHQPRARDSYFPRAGGKLDKVVSISVVHIVHTVYSVNNNVDYLDLDLKTFLGAEAQTMMTWRI